MINKTIAQQSTDVLLNGYCTLKISFQLAVK